MVLHDLGHKLTTALQSLTTSSHSATSEHLLTTLLKDITTALLSADINVKLVNTLRTSLHNTLTTQNLLQKPPTVVRRVLQRELFKELCGLLQVPGGTRGSAWEPVKGKVNVVLFVGLQGSGKTTSVSKVAWYFQRKGWRTGVVCCDTFRAGAFDQLKQNAARARVPFYGSYTESDPVALATQGLAKFRQERFDLIILDTSGRHHQSSALITEMQHLHHATHPDHTIFVLDASIGQSATPHAAAFHAAIPVGSVMLTKLDGHAKGGGAISAVAATGARVMFVGTGEHVQDLERFEVEGFVGRMLGMGDVRGLVERLKEVGVGEDEGLMKKLEQGVFTLRDMYDQFQTLLNMGPLSQVMTMIPGIPTSLFQGDDSSSSSNNNTNDHTATSRLKRFLAIMDSMRRTELDSDGKIFTTDPGRVGRVARGSGTRVWEVEQLLGQFRQFATMVKKMGGKKGLGRAMQAHTQGHFRGSSSSSSSTSTTPSAIPNLSNLSAPQLSSMARNMSRYLNPQLMQNLGGMSGIQDMMREIGSGSGMGDVMSSMMGAGRGRGRRRR